MKKHCKYLFLNLLFSMLLSVPAYSYHIKPLNIEQLLTSPEPLAKVLARGAATPHELASSVLQAIQNNNFEALNAFVLDPEELVLLKKKGSEDMKALLENTSAADLKNYLKTDHEALIKTGINQTINWGDMVVAETKMGKGTTENGLLRLVTVTLMVKQNHPLQLVMETIKLNNRYYLFRQLELKS